MDRADELIAEMAELGLEVERQVLPNGQSVLIAQDEASWNQMTMWCEARFVPYDANAREHDWVVALR